MLSFVIVYAKVEHCAKVLGHYYFYICCFGSAIMTIYIFIY